MTIFQNLVSTEIHSWECCKCSRDFQRMRNIERAIKTFGFVTLRCANKMVCNQIYLRPFQYSPCVKNPCRTLTAISKMSFWSCHFESGFFIRTRRFLLKYCPWKICWQTIRCQVFRLRKKLQSVCLERFRIILERKDKKLINNTIYNRIILKVTKISRTISWDKNPELKVSETWNSSSLKLSEQIVWSTVQNILKFNNFGKVRFVFTHLEFQDPKTQL